MAKAFPSPTEINAAFGSANPAHRVEFAVLDYSNLEIDPGIQRDEVPAEIKRIAKNFNPSALGIFTVSVRDVENPLTGELETRWFLVDGQQRRAALLLLKSKLKVPSFVHYGLSVDEEARLFLDLNHREGVGAWNRYKARLKAEEPQALAIQTLLDSLGIKTTQPGGFQAISQADRIYAASDRGPANLRFALSILHEVYEAYDGRVLNGLAQLYDNYSKVMDVELLRRKLGERAPTIGHIVRNAQTVIALYGGNSSIAFGEALVNIYNWKMHPKARGSKSLPSLYLGRRFKPTGKDLEGLEAMRATQADNEAALQAEDGFED